MTDVSPLARATAHLCRSEAELRFAPPRRWRFDLAWPDKCLALEVEGGAFVRGRHTRGKGFVRDMEKYNEATVRGWRIVRCTPEQVRTMEVLKWVLPILEA